MEGSEWSHHLPPGQLLEARNSQLPQGSTATKHLSSRPGTPAATRHPALGHLGLCLLGALDLWVSWTEAGRGTPTEGPQGGSSAPKSHNCALNMGILCPIPGSHTALHPPAGAQDSGSPLTLQSHPPIPTKKG